MDTKAFWNVWAPNVSAHWQTTAQPKMGCVVCFYLLGFGYDRIARRFQLSKKHIASFIQRRKDKIPVTGRSQLPKIRPKKIKPTKIYKYKRYNSNKRKLKVYLRTKIWRWFKHNEHARSAAALAGCSREEFIYHITSQFKRGMTLQNYAQVWELDHIVPCNQFDLTIPEQRAQAFHFTNYRPLMVIHNRRKSARVITHQPQLLLNTIPPKAGLKSPRTVRTLPSLQQASRNLSNQQTIKGAESCTPLTVHCALVSD